MGKFAGPALLLAAGLLLGGCATGEPRLQGSWRSHKVPMPVEMVKVTKMETVRVRKGSKRTKQVPKTVTVAKAKSGPPYLDLVLTYERASLTIEILSTNNARPERFRVPYEVTASDEKSVVIGLRQPGTRELGQIRISFDGPDRFYVNPAGGEGWKEYYERVAKRG